MPDLSERGQRRAADPLRGRVRAAQLRARGFQRDQFAHQAVVLGIGDLRRIERVIQIVMPMDRIAQLARLARQTAG